MKVVVTGATSMIGVALIKECIENNCEVLAIVRKNTTRIDRLPSSKLLKIVYANLDELDKVVTGSEDYDVFYHFAWGHTAKEERDYPLAQEDNIRTTLQAVELAHKLNCRKFVGAGSQAEYGKVDGVICEKTIANPITSYGIAKLSANMLSRRMCEQFEIKHVWARIFSVYGCLDNEGTMLNYAVDQFIKGETAKFSAATQAWNYLNEQDAGRYFYLLGVIEALEGIYCIANSQSMPLRNYILKLQELYGDNASCEFAVAQNGAAVIGLNADTTKIITDTGYTPKVGFEEGMKKLIEYRKKKIS